MTLEAQGIRCIGDVEVVADASGHLGDLVVDGTLSATTAITSSGSLLALSLKVTSTPASTADPGVSFLHTPNIPKAWAFIDIGNNLATVNDGFNVATAVIDGSNNFVLITFARVMANANYGVVFGVSHETPNAIDFPIAKGRTVNGFELWNFNGCGADAAAAPAAAYSMASGHVGHISFLVMGRQ